AVGTSEPRFAREDFAFRITGGEIAVTGQNRGNNVQPRSGVRTNNCLTGELLPPALRLPIPHDQGAVAQVASVAESQHFLVHFAAEDDGAVTQRAIGDEDRLTIQHVIDDLMPEHNGKRVSACLALDFQHDDGRLRLQPVVCPLHRLEEWTINWWDAIRRRTAGYDLVIRDAVQAEIGALPVACIEAQP